VPAAATVIGDPCAPGTDFGIPSRGAGGGRRIRGYWRKASEEDPLMRDPCLAPARRALLLAGALAPLAPALAGEPGSATIALFGGAADRIEGSGKVIDEPRSVAGFNRVIVQGPLEVRIKAADDDRVVVHADDNIAPLIETSLLGGTLVIGVRAGAAFRTRTDMQVRLQARQLNGVVLRGSGNVRVDRVDADVFDATLQGSGDITVDSLRAEAVAVSIAGNGDVRIKGTARTVGVVLDGSGDVHCADLQAQQVAVRIRGSGDVRVHATGELKVEVDGSGDVHYRGAPQISKSIRGSGSVAALR